MSKLRSAMRRGKEVLIDTTDTTKPRRKEAKTTGKGEKMPHISSPSTYHTFHEPADIVHFRSQLLDWYDTEKRELPWRTLAMTEPDLNIRTYAVWVSEIMLQQTQVATVIDYYNKWMKRWPTVQDLAAATLEEVNQMWAGLGYYSRGKRLHEGAQKVVSELKGEMPRTVDGLLKQLPGVGRYTAGAIGSIALGQVAGVVDGNVVRVLCRVRAIGADSTSPAVTEALWSIATKLVDTKRPGDFNQAMMELGAQVCSPKGPICSQCPIKSHCRSYRKVQIKHEESSKRLLGKSDKMSAAMPDIEECMDSGTCTLCPTEPWNSELGVQNFPRKPAKKAPRVERTLAFVVVRAGDGQEDQYMLTQRPNKGLLAGMWEFPSFLLEGENSEMKQTGAFCGDVGRMLGVQLNKGMLQHLGEVVHIFSHIHQTYVVCSVRLKDHKAAGKNRSENVQWFTRPALQQAAIPTGVKKILKLYDSSQEEQTQIGKRKNSKDVKRDMDPHRSKKTKFNAVNNGKRQLSLSSFFKTIKEET